MTFDLGRIKTLVIVMMENRSFDHVLGHLSLPPFGDRIDVRGLDRESWVSYANPVAGERPHMPFSMREDMRLPHDLPHEREFVATQIGAERDMTGFVRAYYECTKQNGIDHPTPMGFCTADMVPVSSFLASQFCVCDAWFAPLPASTMPNRLMAFSGDAHVDRTGSLVPNAGPLILDWLTNKGVRWRVYHDGVFSFFTLFLRPEVLGEKFRRFTSLAADLASGDVPDVVLIEPTYYDAPHFRANDNHAPLQIGAGEHFLRDVYDVLSSSSNWKNMLIVFTHDEHGGFFDHVSPPEIPYDPPANATYTQGFETMGVRVPAIVVSPFLRQRVYGQLLDHTSILQFLAERFDPGGPGYSDSVNRRRDAGVQSLSDVLSAASTPEGESVAPTVPNDSLRIESMLEFGTGGSALGQAFSGAGRHYMTNFAEQARTQLPELWHLLR